MIKVILFCHVIQWKYCCLVQLDLGITKGCMSWLFFKHTPLGSWFLHLYIMPSVPSYPLTSGWHLSIRDYKGPLCMWAFIIYNWLSPNSISWSDNVPFFWGMSVSDSSLVTLAMQDYSCACMALTVLKLLCKQGCYLGS